MAVDVAVVAAAAAADGAAWDATVAAGSGAAWATTAAAGSAWVSSLARAAVAPGGAKPVSLAALTWATLAASSNLESPASWIVVTGTPSRFTVTCVSATTKGATSGPRIENRRSTAACSTRRETGSTMATTSGKNAPVTWASAFENVSVTRSTGI